MDLCQFDSCTNFKRANGYCAGHNKQLKDGRPLVALLTYGKNKGKVCTGPECSRPAESRGMCSGHKAQDNRGEQLSVLGSRRPGRNSRYDGVACRFDDCERPAYALALCRSHHAQVQRGTPLRPLGWREAPIAASCHAEGCEASGTKVGFCERHYRQARRRGIIGWDGTVCADPGCDRPAVRGKSCEAHYARRQREAAGPCSVDDCGKPIVGRNLCSAHYRSLRLYGDPLVTRKKARAICSIPDCPNPPASGGLCAKHATRVRRYGTTELPPKPIVAPMPAWQCRQCGADLEKLTRGRPSYCSQACREAWQFWDRQQKHRGRWLKQYGLTVGQFDEMLASQGSACAICRSTEPGYRNWSVDHCHATGRVRGLLCLLCNTGLGKFRDNPDLMRRAIEYLAVPALT